MSLSCQALQDILVQSQAMPIEMIRLVISYMFPTCLYCFRTVDYLQPNSRADICHKCWKEDLLFCNVPGMMMHCFGCGHHLNEGLCNSCRFISTSVSVMLAIDDGLQTRRDKGTALLLNFRVGTNIFFLGPTPLNKNHVDTKHRSCPSGCRPDYGWQDQHRL